MPDDYQLDRVGPEVDARRAQRVGRLQRMVPLHPPATGDATSDLHVEAASS